MLEKLSNIIKKISEVISVIFLAIITSVTLTQIFYRYVLGNALDWPEEVARYALIWMVLLSFNIIAQEDKNIAVTIVSKKIPDNIKYFIDILLEILKLLFAAMLIYHGYQKTKIGWMITSPALQIKRAWVYYAIPVGSSLLFYQVIVRIKKKLSHLIEKGDR